MTLQIANGFNLIPIDPAFFEAPADDNLMTGTDVADLLRNPAGWFNQTMQATPFELIERDLTPQSIGPVLLEFLTSVAVLNIGVKATAVMPVKAMGRVVMVDYTPWKREDPPIPLLNLLNDLPARALAISSCWPDA